MKFHQSSNSFFWHYASLDTKIRFSLLHVWSVFHHSFMILHGLSLLTCFIEDASEVFWDGSSTLSFHLINQILMIRNWNFSHSKLPWTNELTFRVVSQKCWEYWWSFLFELFNPLPFFDFFQLKTFMSHQINEEIHLVDTNCHEIVLSLIESSFLFSRNVTWQRCAALN